MDAVLGWLVSLLLFVLPFEPAAIDLLSVCFPASGCVHPWLALMTFSSDAAI